MQTISTIEELKIAIRLAEVKHSINGKLLKEQFLMTCETLRPGNLLMSTIKEVTSIPNLAKLVTGTALGLTTGYLSRKVAVGASATVLRKILASVLQLTATTLFSNNASSIESFGKSIQLRLSKINIP